MLHLTLKFSGLEPETDLCLCFGSLCLTCVLFDVVLNFSCISEAGKFALDSASQKPLHVPRSKRILVSCAPQRQKLAFVTTRLPISSNQGNCLPRSHEVPPQKSKTKSHSAKVSCVNKVQCHLQILTMIRHDQDKSQWQRRV